MLHALKSFNDGLIEGVGKGIIWFIPLMAIAVNLVVILRYGFGQATVLLQETALYLHAAAFMLGLAYTLKHNNHVRVDLLYNRWSARRQATVNLLGHSLFLIPTALVMGFGSWEYVLRSWLILEGSPEAGGIPAVFLLKTLIPLSALLLFLQGLSGIAQALTQLGLGKP